MNDQQSEQHYLEQALTCAEESVSRGGFPCGALVVLEDRVLAFGQSLGDVHLDATEHAEVAAIRRACGAANSQNLRSGILYSSLEPCIMCLAACSWAQIERVIYACRRSVVAPEYYEGNLTAEQFVQTLHHPIHVEWSAGLEEEALMHIKAWEKDQTAEREGP